jgi:hypothetical protein
LSQHNPAPVRGQGIPFDGGQLSGMINMDTEFEEALSRLPDFRQRLIRLLQSEGFYDIP